MFNVNNWTGAVVVIVLLGLVLGLLLGFQEVLNPISAQGKGDELRLKNEHLQRMYELEEQKKQLEVERARRVYELAEEKKLQGLEQARQQHEVWMAFLNRYLPVLLVGGALGLAGLGAGLGYYLYCRGLRMRVEENPAAAALPGGGGRIVQFPVPPQERKVAN